jgi:O-antigen/teichoic acid export membrane protein
MSLQGAKLQRAQGLLQMFERTAILAGVLVFMMSARLEFTSVVVCYIAAPAITALIGLVQLRKLIFHSFSFDGTFLKKLMLYSLPLLPFSLIGYFSGSYVDAVFIANFLSLRDLGIYAVATQINGIALQFPTLAAALLVPFFVSLDKEGDETKLRSYFTNALPNLTITCGVIAAVAALAAYFLIPVVFGTEFSAAAVPFWILIASTVAAIPVLCGYAPLTHARSVTYIAAIVSVASAAVNVGLDVLLIPKYGMVGCAWATLIAYLCTFVGFALFLRQRVKMPLSWIFLSVAPLFASCFVLAVTSNVWAAALTTLAASAAIAALKWESVTTGVDILKRVVAR